MFEHVDEDVGSDGQEAADQIACGIIFFKIVSGFADDFMRVGIEAAGCTGRFFIVPEGSGAAVWTRGAVFHSRVLQ